MTCRLIHRAQRVAQDCTLRLDSLDRALDVLLVGSVQYLVDKASMHAKLANPAHTQAKGPRRARSVQGALRMRTTTHQQTACNVQWEHMQVAVRRNATFVLPVRSTVIRAQRHRVVRVLRGSTGRRAHSTVPAHASIVLLVVQTLIWIVRQDVRYATLARLQMWDPLYVSTAWLVR